MSGSPTAAATISRKAVGHLGEDLHAAFGFTGQSRAHRFAFRLAGEDLLLFLAFRLGAYPVALDFRWHDDVGVLRGAVAFSPGHFGTLFRRVALLFGRGGLDRFGGVAPSFGLGLSFS